MPKAAAIYARISSDRAGDALGVKRQVSDCEAEADRRGWPVAEVYIDDDVSAYNGKPRPGYQRMLADIAAGSIDAVVVYHLDRLHRRPKELEEFVEVCDAARLKHVATVQGDVDLGTGDGMLVARIMAAVAANESHAKSRRVRRKMDELAETGKPHGGSNRPFGYEADRITVRSDEAAIIRDLADRFLAGESLASLVGWLSDNDVPTVRGGRWRATTVRGLLTSPRIAGLRQHRGDIVGEAVWPAIITPAQSEQIRAKFADPSRRTNRAPRRYLLAGLLRCHACGAVMLSNPRNGVRRYICKPGADFLGCGKTYIVADPVEQLVAEAVLFRLDTPALAAALDGQAADDQETTVLADQIEQERAQLEELAGLYAEREITAREWTAARKPIEARLKRAEQRLRRLQRTTVLDGLPGHGSELRRQWSTLNLDRQQAIVAAILDHAVIGPGTRSGRRFDSARVRPVWKL